MIGPGSDKNICKGVCAYMFVCKNIRIHMFLRRPAYITVYGVEDKPCLYGGVVYGPLAGIWGSEWP